MSRRCYRSSNGTSHSALRQETTMQKVTAAYSTLRPARELAGKTAIVTGSTSGIGLGIAPAFAEAGMHVMLNGFGDNAENERTRMELAEGCYIKTAYSAADMSRPEDIVGLIEDARRLLGKVDVLVNNAGISTSRRSKRFLSPSGTPSSPSTFPLLSTPCVR